MIPMHQKATYWSPGQPDGFGGVTWSPPVILPCRWVQEQKMIRNKAGAEIVSQAEVYLPQPVDLSGRLYLGESSEPDPTVLPDAKEPQAIESMTDLGGRTVGWRVWL